MRLYEVGGCIRDEILGIPSKDIDFSVVLEEQEVNVLVPYHGDAFGVMVAKLKGMGFKIFLETPEYLTVRAQFPNGRTYDGNGHNYGTNTADFVLARKESTYTDGRRPDVVEPGTLMDDLARRDFTMNAIAKDADGSYIDPFNGLLDIEAGIIRAVGDPFERLTEDALRAVRALRFSVTKGFTIHHDLRYVMGTAAVLDAIENKISDERIKDELSKMFRHDTVASLVALNAFPALTRAMFSGTVSLDATMKTKGRNGNTGRPKPNNGNRNLPPAQNGCKCSCHVDGGKHISRCC